MQSNKSYRDFGCYAILMSIGLILFYSCDDINVVNYKRSYNQSSNIDPSDTGVYKIDSVQNILLMDFTGHNCINCPSAHKIADALKDTYSNLIVLAVHSGKNADPRAMPDKYDFMTAVGTQYDLDLGINGIHPNGTINNTVFSTGLIVDKDNWGGRVQEINKLIPAVSMQLLTTFDTVSKKIKADVYMNFMKECPATTNLVILIKEDSIVKYQLTVDSSGQNSFKDPNYIHNNVLRGSFNGAWGDPVKDSVIKAGTRIGKSYTYTITSDKDWKPKDLTIIAILLNNTVTDGPPKINHQIYQVAKKKLF
ncbi:MAG: Omp28-related outer membrane protein [Candidatus Kapabacteria bacterium]|nr:Omp28-related outer membrane protein [Candidatus Kapabacteria bacterium]